jgi:ATP-binding cassette subfamily B protein
MADSLRLVSTKLRGALAQLAYLPRALSLVWAAARDWTSARAFLPLIQGLLPVATVWLTRLRIDHQWVGLCPGHR